VPGEGSVPSILKGTAWPKVDVAKKSTIRPSPKHLRSLRRASKHARNASNRQRITSRRVYIDCTRWNGL